MYNMKKSLLAMVLAALVPLNIYIPYDLTDWLKNGVNLLFKAPLWVLLSGVLLAVGIGGNLDRLSLSEDAIRIEIQYL